MQALILAGGKGTRLRPLTVYTPKPIVPLVNRPFLLFQIEILKRAGIDEIILSLSYQPNKIEDLLGDGSEFGVNIRYITEPNPLGTGGAYRFAADYIKGPTIVLNGDILTNVDLSAVMKVHSASAAEATIVLAPVDNPSAYGLVETESNGRVKKFLEKPKGDDLAGSGINTINAGVYILEPSVLDIIPKSENRSFEYHVFPELLAGDRPVFSYLLDNYYWRDLGTPESYLAANMDLISGKVSGFAIERVAGTDVAHTASVDGGSLLAQGCTVKPSATITNSVLGPGVFVEEKAVIENSVIWGHTRISSSAEVRGAVLARSCHIGRNAILRPGTVLGDKASIPDYSKA